MRPLIESWNRCKNEESKINGAVSKLMMKWNDGKR